VRQLETLARDLGVDLAAFASAARRPGPSFLHDVAALQLALPDTDDAQRLVLVAKRVGLSAALSAAQRHYASSLLAFSEVDLAALATSRGRGFRGADSPGLPSLPSRPSRTLSLTSPRSAPSSTPYYPPTPHAFPGTPRAHSGSPGGGGTPVDSPVGDPRSDFSGGGRSFKLAQRLVAYAHHTTHPAPPRARCQPKSHL
jgi:hypothetical protein